MSEQPLLNVSDNTALGKVEIAPEVIEVIAGIAATEVDGVYAMRGNFATGVVERFGKKAHNKGIKVELLDDGVSIDVYVILNFGVSIPQVAQQLQTNIRQTLTNMTALELKEVNVHVVGVQMNGREDAEAQE
ncbi:Asp23/Gls24 family envelope stress response protein [Oceanobacillus profundus]|uniref:Asp23/Gls24 family envelope stress response protein n=1 Tax=Oceanobacillus profundus TaxID=372463 RepID=A0A417YFZ5_9BACI|nr:Asp23/Gls24 family envelope stress response protein [Oceanobacillus profundus]MBR3118919.1 Asp23/Gls24 family envelope stress response protein [Oceanobacillus sp.]PAE31175.1 Asp23/Gls24 family envelope stress response protein [Paenibacillus sp. 7884-2]MCM3396725.1 Asp23/Gls24 family envelope stress response protein [Oceanobacillus profundus]MDO6450819.1 Asp23/Gls24 family envelope stress response protein [Oceanobacillus profundus]RHW31682.1 Asp23/Gls24 family envelope stress response protei